MAEAKELVHRRDARVDEIGIIGELAGEKHLDLIRADVKSEAIARGVDILEGDCFDGRMGPGWIPKRIDARQLYQLWKKKVITEDQFFSVLSVYKKGTEEFLSKLQIAAMSIACGVATPTLTVFRKKGVELTIVQAVERLAARMAAKKS